MIRAHDNDPAYEQREKERAQERAQEHPPMHLLTEIVIGGKVYYMVKRVPNRGGDNDLPAD